METPSEMYLSVPLPPSSSCCCLRRALGACKTCQNRAGEAGAMKAELGGVGAVPPLPAPG